MQLAESDIVKKIRDGHIGSFEQVFRAYCNELVRYATTIVKDADEAQDVVQHLFVSLWNKRESLEVNTSLKSYLYRAVHNTSLNRIRQHAVKETYVAHAGYVADQEAAEASSELDGREMQAAIDKAISDLPLQCRRIFVLSRFEGLKYQEIADQMGISVKTVENQMGKALKHMRTKLKPYMPVVLFWLLLNP